ncbi:MAG: M67 family metallopeptidase [Phycisphaerae bacterium]
MTRRDVESMRLHAAEALPDECCGLLVGTVDPQGLRVLEVRRAANVWEGDRHRRFLIDPRLQLQAQRQARARGLDVVGAYHSHPEGPAVPSAFDKARAFAGFCHVIVTPPAGDGGGETRCWRFDEAGDEFVECSLEIEEDGGA